MRELNDVGPSHAQDTLSGSKYFLLIQAAVCLIVMVVGCGHGKHGPVMLFFQVSDVLVVSLWSSLCHTSLPISKVILFKDHNSTSCYLLTVVFRGHLFFSATTLLNCPTYINGQYIWCLWLLKTDFLSWGKIIVFLENVKTVRFRKMPPMPVDLLSPYFMKLYNELKIHLC